MSASAELFVSRAPFGGLSCQVRALRAQGDEPSLDEAFTAAVSELGGSLNKGAAIDPGFRTLQRETFDALSLAPGRTLTLSTALWLSEDDEILVMTFDADPFKRDPDLADSLVSFLVEAIRAIHTQHPIRAALIGEEGFVASRFLGLWGTASQPQRGSPGTLWPEGEELQWFPLSPV